MLWRKNEGDEVGVWERVGRWLMVGVLGGVDRLFEETICCPQLAVATPMGLQILTHFDNVSVELYPWLCVVRVCEGVTVSLCVCVYACYAILFSYSSSLATTSSYSHLVL